MPRSFLLKRSEEKMTLARHGSKIKKSLLAACGCGNEKDTARSEYSHDDGIKKSHYVKMIPKPLKAFRVNPYGNDACKLCEIDGCRARGRGSRNTHEKCIQGKKNHHGVDNLLEEKQRIEHNYDFHDRNLGVKKSSVSIMNIKHSPKVVEGFKARSPVDESRLRYKSSLWIEAEQRTRISDPACVPSPYLTSPTHSYRSSETGSANSTGSGCNSYVTPRSSVSGFSSPDVYNSRYPPPTVCKQPCCTTNERNDKPHYAADPYPYSLHERDKRGLVSSEEDCNCLQCDVNREFLRRGSRYVETIMISDNYMLAKRKRLSKRKALLTELELESKRKSSLKCITTLPRELNNNNNALQQYHIRQKRKPSATDVLEIPAGPNRSRAVANLLERRRVAELNSSFETLRVLVPTYGNEDRTLSKIKTLKYALTYIEHLMTVLTEYNSDKDFDLEKDIIKLCRKDPLIQKSREHMKNNRKLF